jgi:hypothetical protein
MSNSGEYKVTVEGPNGYALEWKGYAETVTDALVAAQELRDEQWQDEQEEQREQALST